MTDKLTDYKQKPRNVPQINFVLTWTQISVRSALEELSSLHG
jgi:hypothetical protein